MRLAVASPFVDRRHGTERALAELLERLARDYDCEIHLYAQRVQDLEVVLYSARSSSPSPGSILWNRVPSLAGPHLLQFRWWYFVNYFQRRFDARLRALRFDLIYSPGINCADANAITVHACFHSLAERGCEASRGPTGVLPLRRLHHALYYRLLCRLESRLYSRRETALATVSPRTAAELNQFFRREDVVVIPNGVDTAVFQPDARLARRDEARRSFGFGETEFVVLLIGNDWHVKGLPLLLESAAACRDLPLHLLVAGQDDRHPFLEASARLNLQDRLHFAHPSTDVLRFYAAADAYASPTLEDSFALPALEAMACGLPVILSSRAGLSAWLENGVNALILQDPGNVSELAARMRELFEDVARRKLLGANAARVAESFTWDRNAALTWEFLKAVAARKQSV